MNERRFVPSDCPKCEISFAVYDNILKKGRSVLEWKAIRHNGVV